MGFKSEYAALVEEFCQRVELNRAHYRLSRDDCIWAPMMQPLVQVDHVFIGSEPSLKRWAPSEAVAKSVIAEGFKISATNIEDFILHFSIRKFLRRSGETYAVTDLSKGGMRVNQADKERDWRYHQWYPLLRKELALVRKPSSVIWAIGDTVKDFLDGKGIVSCRITHFSWQRGADRNQYVVGKEQEFREFAATVSLADLVGTARDVTRDAGFSNRLAATTVSRVQRSPLTESRMKLIFAYKTEFEGSDASEASVSPHVAQIAMTSDQKRGTPSSFNSTVKRNNLTVIDKRASGGCLWVVGGPELREDLEPVGFQFAERGGKATHGKPSWWLRGEPKAID